jgi:transposase
MASGRQRRELNAREYDRRVNVFDAPAICGGMSKRQAAKALGVSEGTVRGDVGAEKVRKNAQKLRTPDIEEMPSEEEVHEECQQDLIDQACLLQTEFILLDQIYFLLDRWRHQRCH